MVPGIYRAPRETPVRGRELVGGLDREREWEGGGRNAPMANTQTDEFIKTVTANRAKPAKAGHYKEVWFYERRQREGEREMQIGRGETTGRWSDWLGSREEGVV